MTRVKNFEATGVAPLGRLYAGDLLAIQDHYADLSNFSQVVGVGTLQVGDTSLMLVKYGTGEFRMTGAVRTDGILRALGGLYAGAFTTAQRDAIAVNLAPFGLIILNTTLARFQWNSGTDAARVWTDLSGDLANMPSAGQKAALAGTVGTPADTNRYVTAQGLAAIIGGGVITVGSPAGGDLAGTYPNPTVIQASGPFSLPGDASPTALAADANDYNPAGFSTSSTLKLSSSVDVSITGLAGGTDGRFLIIHNIGNKLITLRHEHTGSSAVNRFSLPSFQDIPIAGNEVVLAQYDSISLRWRLTGRTAPASFTGCAVYVTAGQALAAGANVLVTWGGEDLDTSGFHAPGASRVTIPAGLSGVYEIDCFLAATDGDCVLYLKLNGVTNLVSASSAAAANPPAPLVKTTALARCPFITLTAADYIEAYVKNAPSGNAGTVAARTTGQPATGTMLTIRKIG